MATTAQLTEASTSNYVEAGGIRLHYNEAGTGEPLVAGTSAWGNTVGAGNTEHTAHWHAAHWPHILQYQANTARP